MKQMRFHFSLYALFVVFISYGQTISPYLIGNNYWYPGGNAATLMAPGKEMQTAGFQLIRIGGFGANSYSNANFVTYIDLIRAMGAEPIVQVAEAKTTQQVIDMITYINVTMKRNVKFWAIGNEPEHTGGGNKSDTYVYDYTIRIAPALKAVDPTIKIIALETSGYVATWLDKMLDGSLDITGKDANGRYYVDIIGWHNYGWNDNTNSVVAQMDDMVARLAKANAARPESPIMWMMGEINTHWDNTMATTDGKVWSFRAGQSYAVLYGAAMARNALTIAFWSIYEGKNYQGVVDRGGNDLSLFDVDNVARSNYWHSLMLGQNIRANYAVSSDNRADIRTVAMKDGNGVSVMIMNSSKTTAYTYAAKLDATAFTSTQNVNVNVDAAINATYTDEIPLDASHMLVFNNRGELMKKYEYTAINAEARVAPTVTNYTTAPIVYDHILPKKVEAEEYSLQEGLTVEKVTPSEGIGQDLGYTTAGDYVEYAIEVPNTGDFSVDFRIASLAGNAGFSVSVDGNIVIDEVAVPATGGWQVWSSVNENMTLAAGKHTLRLTITKAGFNINWINFKALQSVPGIIEAEDYSSQFGLQAEEVDLSEGVGYDLGFTSVGDYAEYAINVSQSASYPIDFRIASLNGGAGLSLSVDGAIVIDDLAIDATGGWQMWKTISSTVALTAGVHTLRFDVIRAGFNINWIDIKQLSVAPIEPVVSFALPTATTISGNVQFQATAYDATVGTNDADGIDSVVFVLKDADGITVGEKIERTATYDYYVNTLNFANGDYQMTATAYSTENASVQLQLAQYDFSILNTQGSQTISLTVGWNLVSLYVTPDNNAVATVFPNASIVKNSDAFYSDSQTEYLNSLTTINSGEAYLVYNSTAEDVVLTGKFDTRTATPLKTGWNMIGLPVRTNISVANLPAENQVVKDFDVFYISGGVGSLSELIVGKGYFIKVSDNCVISW